MTDSDPRFSADSEVQIPLSTDMVLTAAREVQTHLNGLNKPYSAGIVGDCIVEIERLRDRITDAAQGAVDSILLPRRLTAENGAKAALIGEFSETVEIMDEDGEEHPMDVPVSWDTIKRIWVAAVAHFDASQPSPAATVERSAILEEAARIADNGCLVPPDGGSPTDDEREMCESIATQIRLLKLKGAEEVFEPHNGSSAGTTEKCNQCVSQMACQQHGCLAHQRCSAATEDVRWAVNYLLEQIAAKFEAWETFDLFRSEAASTVRSFKHDLSSVSPQTALDRKTIANAVEPIILRRLHEKKVDGYTLPMSWELADAILAVSRPHGGIEDCDCIGAVIGQHERSCPLASQQGNCK